MKELNGWFETEYGACPINVACETLFEGIMKVRKGEDGEDFGHTDMEVNFGTLEDHRDVAKEIYIIVESGACNG